MEQIDIFKQMQAAITALQEQVATLIASLGPSAGIPAGSVPAPVPVVIPEAQTYPKIVLHRGVQYMLNAPLPDKFENSMSANVFGKPPNFVRDPSNAPAGFPLRSPAGWPLFYPLDGYGHPAGAPYLDVGTQTFKDEDTVNEYFAKIEQQNSQAAQDKINADWAEWDKTFIASIEARKNPRKPDPAPAPVVPPTGEGEIVVEQGG
jgi:hypothetical protein